MNIITVKFGRPSALVLLLITLVACNTNERRVDETPVHISFVPYYTYLAKPDSVHVRELSESLMERYPYFTRMYTEGLLKVKLPTDNSYPNDFYQFVSDPIYQEVYDTVLVHYNRLERLESEIRAGVGRMETLFPGSGLKQVYWIVSGFNEAIAVGDSLVGVSLEHYLGAKHEFYDRLGVYNYLRIRKERERIPIDILEAWLRTEFVMDQSKDKLLDAILYEGKILYALQLCLPERSMSEILAYTTSQYNWAKQNEKGIWTKVIEWKHLYSTESDVYRQYIGEAPFTKFYGQNSAPQIGRFIGWHIVASYMENNEQVSFAKLFANTNAQQLLQLSHYNP